MKSKNCAYCGKPFTPRSSRAIYCKGPHFMICPICGKEYQVTNNDKLKFPPTACSYKCRTIKRTQTSLKRYGCTAPGNNPKARKKASETMMKNLGVPYAMMSEEVQSKSKKTLIEKYGVDNIGKHKATREKRMETERKNHGGVLAFNTKESYEHRRKTVLDKYGCEVFASQEIRDKIKKTMLQKYGHEFMMQVPELKKKQQKTLFNHYGVKSAFSSKEIRKKSEQTMIKRYGVSNASYSEELVKKAEQTMLKKYGRSARVSKINMEFYKLLENNNITYTPDKCICDIHVGKFYDICIENTNIVIEINPTYTHNSIGNHWNNPLPNDYHIAKTNLAKEHGYRCIHVWDWDDWNNIIKLIIPRTKIYARKCKIFKLYDNTGSKFLQENDINGSNERNLLYLGLTYEDKLVQVMTFGKPNDSEIYTVELIQLCSLSGYEIVGGASKLFNFATKYMELDNIVTYCDLSKFSGEVYEKMCMKFVRREEPHRIWSRQSEIIDERYTIISEDKEKYMIENYWLPVHDCGYDVYEYRSSDLTY